MFKVKSMSEIDSDKFYYAAGIKPNPNKMLHFAVDFKDEPSRVWDLYIHPEDIWTVLMFNIENHSTVGIEVTSIEMIN